MGVDKVGDRLLITDITQTLYEQVHTARPTAHNALHITHHDPQHTRHHTAHTTTHSTHSTQRPTAHSAHTTNERIPKRTAVPNAPARGAPSLSRSSTTRG
eukprot:1888820-Prymnesium_polylepis.2